MPEHVNILDSQRHEAKHASTASLNQVLHAKGDGTTEFKFLDYSTLVNVPVPKGYVSVLTSASTAASQQPSAVDTPLQVEFGPGEVTTDVTLASDGKLTFNQPGDYFVTVFLRYGRTTSTGQAILFNRFLVNGVQLLNSNVVKLPDQDIVVPFSATLAYTAEAGDIVTMQIMRDSAGVNNGGLFRITPTLAGWAQAPSATVVVSKFVGEAVGV